MKKGFKCQNCGKGIMYGHNVSHAKNRTRRIFKPNLHVAHLTINGTAKILRLCTKCLRKLKSPVFAKASVDKQNSKFKSEAQNSKVDVPQEAPSIASA